MSASEFADWDAYVELYGPLDMRQRLDHAAARIAFTVHRVHGGKTEFRKFLDFPPPTAFDDEEDLTDMDRMFAEALRQPGQNVDDDGRTH